MYIYVFCVFVMVIYIGIILYIVRFLLKNVIGYCVK